MRNFPDQVRFNWGYHDAQTVGGLVTPDGAIRNEQWAENHFDMSYGAGFHAGLKAKENGTYSENSEAAWKEFSQL